MTKTLNMSGNTNTTHTYGVNLYQFINLATGEQAYYYCAHKEDRSAEKFLEDCDAGIKRGHNWKLHQAVTAWRPNLHVVKHNLSSHDLTKRQAEEGKKIAINSALLDNKKVLNSRHVDWDLISIA